MKNIRNEYWIANGHVEFADGDVGDVNHEYLATLHVLHQFLDNIISLAEEFNIDTSHLDLDQPDQNEFAIILGQIRDEVREKEKKEPDADKFIMRQIECGKEAYAILINGKGADSHGYVMKYEGWIAVRGMNIELYGYDENKRKSLLNGLYEIFDQEGIEEDVPPEQIEFDLNDLRTKKQTYISLANIQNSITLRPSNDISSVGHTKFNDPTDEIENIKTKNKSIPNKYNQVAQRLNIIPKGSQLWRPTSEWFNFKEWLIQ